MRLYFLDGNLEIEPNLLAIYLMYAIHGLINRLSRLHLIQKVVGPCQNIVLGLVYTTSNELWLSPNIIQHHPSIASQVLHHHKES